MRVHIITETLLASNETNVTEVYSDREKALNRVFDLQNKYESDGFSYEITAMEVKQ